MRKYEYYKEALSTVHKPCAFIDGELFQQNIHTIKDNANKKKIRIASKSIRSVDILKMIFEVSPIFQGVMCYTAEEAIFLHENGLDDLLIAYPIWNEKELRKICRLTKNGATITVMVDCMEHIERLEMIALEESGQFLVCVDVDLSTNIFGLHFGVYRSPLKTIEETVDFIERIVQSSYVTLDGIMGYEAQIAGVTDNDPSQKLRSSLIRLLKRKSSKIVIEKRELLVEQLNKRNIPLRFVNGGGTGSLHQTSKEEGVTEVTVGSGFYNSHLFDKYEALQLQPAVGFAIEITRIPQYNMYTCFGGGYVASGAVSKDKLPEIFLPKGARLTKNEGVGEVQTPIVYDGPIDLNIGDPIFLRHSKAGELCERFHELNVIQDGKVTHTFRTYRGEGQCFL